MGKFVKKNTFLYLRKVERNVNFNNMLKMKKMTALLTLVTIVTGVCAQTPVWLDPKVNQENEERAVANYFAYETVEPRRTQRRFLCYKHR